MKLIVRLKGGLGNQLFGYAAARRLALVNRAELVLDDVSGFARDWQYRRQFMLDSFNISGRRATPAERFEPFERYRRGMMKWVSRRSDPECLHSEVPKTVHAAVQIVSASARGCAPGW